MIEIHIQGPLPKDLRCEEGGQIDGDDATKLSFEIEELLREEYEYLNVEGVIVDVMSVAPEDADDFPDE